MKVMLVMILILMMMMTKTVCDISLIGSFLHCLRELTHTREAYNVAMLLSLKAIRDDDDHHIHHNVVSDDD